ncbi:MAG: hypothetical protein Kow0063_08670 [Anaerolineae bacterium]
MYDRQITEDQTLTFGVSGMLYRNGLIMYDHQTRSLWSHILGQAIAGDFKGTQLELIAALQTDWASWKERHPETQVINPGLFGRDGYTGYYRRPDAGVLGRSTRPDMDLGPKEFVIGVRLGGEVKAYPFRLLSQQPAVNDTVAGIPLVVFFDKGSAAGAVFSRELDDGRLLTFEPGQTLEVAVDTETGSEWDIFTGTATSGPLQGTRLTQIPITYAFWFGWADYHPDGEVYSLEQ